jgi:chemotaxis protein methyltransferase WspC
MSRQAIEARLAREMGLDVCSLGPEAINRAVRARTKALGLAPGCWDDYFEALERNRAEWDELVECLVVPETWFFRDRAAFEELRRRARAWWATGPPAGNFRVLCFPCATGEEAYSVAISLLDEGLPADRIEVVGIDLSRRNLETARRAVYRPRAVKEVPGATLGLYFRTEGAGVELLEKIRRVVAFRHGNAVDPAVVAGLGIFQVIFCRNLLIYLTADARERVAESLDRLLEPGGMLAVGHAERLRFLDQRFTPMTGRGLFAYVKGVVRKAELPPLNPLPARPPVPRIASTKRPMVRVPAPMIADQPKALPPAEQARRLADRKDYAGAATACEEGLRRSGADVTLLHLLAVVRQALGEHAEAERLFRRVLYLEPEHGEALLALSLIASKRGDRAEAERLRKRAERAEAREGER